MHKEYERMLQRVDREIEIEETLSAILYSIIPVLYVAISVIAWLLAGY